MAKDDDTVWEGCPIRFGMGVFGDKWTLLIIRDLMFKGKKHFGEFSDPEERISTNILADRLARLQRQGVITKQPDPHNRSKFVYGLTQKGLDLLPVMLAIVDWAQRYDPHTEVPAEFITRLRKDPAAFRRQLLAELGRR